MPSTREIRRRIRSSKNVAKITRAMEMVSASKMRRAQRNVLATRPYYDRIIEVMSELSGRMQGAVRQGTLLEERPEVKTVGVLLVTPDRGLAGSLVSNILRRVTSFVREQRAEGREVILYTVGKKGRDFVRRYNIPVEAEVIGLSDEPALVDILGVTTNIIEGFRYAPDSNDQLQRTGRLDEVYLVYSEFVNTLTQRPQIKRVLPIEPPAAPNEGTQPLVDFTYEPSQEELLDELLPRYAEAQIYQAVLESIASEHSARMVAMRNATNNAKDLVRDLTLTYNKVRQASVTAEVTEIASSAIGMEQN